MNTSIFGESVRTRILGLAVVGLAALGVPATGMAAGPEGRSAVRTAEVAAARVELSRFDAVTAGDQVLVRWETSLERGVANYNLDREVDGQWRRVNSKPLAAVRREGGAKYQVVDASPSGSDASRYRIEAITLTGQSQVIETRELTPSGRANAVDLALPSAGPVDAPVTEVEPAFAEEVIPERQVRLAAPAAIDLPGGSVRVKMVTAAPGMHFVSTATLATLLGQSTATVQPWIDHGDITLSNKGQPVNFVPGNGRINSTTLGPGIYFYAEQHINNYANRNVYWLQSGHNSFGTWPGGSPASVAPGPFTATLTVADDREEWIGDNPQPSETDFWYLQNSALSAGTAFDTYSTSLTVEKLVRTVGTTATLKVELQGTSYSNHRVEVRLNGNLLGTPHDWSGMNPSVAQYTFDATTATALAEAPTANPLTITAVLAPGETLSSIRINSYSLVYRRYYSATSSTASPSASSMEAGVEANPTVSVPNFGTDASAPVILGFDVTDVRNLRSITGLTIDKAADGTWQGSFNPDPALSEMRFAMIKPLVNNSARVLTSSSLSVVSPANLADPSNQGSYLTIAPSTLASSAAALAAYRSPAFRTKQVLLDDIFNEFSYGLVTPHAIADFLETAYLTWSVPPRYVALVGDGTWDYRNRYGFGNNLVPPLMINTPWGLAASDTLFGQIGTGVPRIVIGRFPVKLAADFTTILNKIASYEAESPAAMKALLIADTPDAAGDFIAGINEAEHYLSPTFSSEKVMPPGNAAARSQIQTAMNDGVDVVNYIGHGAKDRLGPGGSTYFMQVIQTPLSLDPPVSNGGRLPILVVMTCVAGDFAHPSTVTVSEGYLRQANAGAAAVIAPTGLSYDAEAARLNRRILEYFSHNRSGRLGDAFLQSVSMYLASGGGGTPAWNYNVIGDPALRLKTAGP